MMNQLEIIFLFLTLFSITLFANEHPACRCATSENDSVQPDTAFIFKSGKTIGLCGNATIDNKDISFSGFKLLLCAPDSIIGSWDDNKTCRIAFNRDTLKVQEELNLPVGREFGYIPVPLLIHKFFFVKSVLKQKSSINTAIRKYSAAEIAATLKQYELAPKPVMSQVDDLFNRLFVAAISGNAKAKKYFMAFRSETPELDPDAQIQYDELTAILKLR